MCPFSFLDFLISFLYAVPYLLIAKILASSKGLQWKEGLFFLVAASTISLVIRINQNLCNFPFHALGDFTAVILFFFYFYKIAKRTVRISIILALFTFMLGILIEHPLAYGVIYFFPALPTQRDILSLVVYIVPLYLLTISVTLLLQRKLRKPFLRIVQIEPLQTTLALLCATLFILLQATVNVYHYIGHSVSIFSWDALLALALFIAIFICFSFYARFLNATTRLEQEEFEKTTLLYYMDELERNQSTIQKFKHDYRNILSSLHLFIAENNWEALQEYYTDRITPTLNIIAQDTFSLEGLEKIKQLEIKGILFAKLTLANNLGLNASLEVNSIIDNLPTDPIALVRMLGIILDNAIEELEQLPDGKLVVVCFKVEHSTHIVIQNTCREDIPSLHEILTPGFSSKGKGRGQGLDNLQALCSTLPNVTLSTSIEDGTFIQRLSIGG